MTDKFLPDDLHELVLRLGKVEWCGIGDANPEQLGKCFQSMIENTHETHGLEPVQTCHYVAVGNLSVAMVGTSPNSGKIAQLITGLWNYAVERAQLDEQVSPEAA